MEIFRTGTMSLTLVKIHLCKALIVNTILSDQLQEMVDNATAQREMKFIKKRNLTMKSTPWIYPDVLRVKGAFKYKIDE